MKKYKDAHYRSIVKALSWRILATLTSMSLAFAFIRKLFLSVEDGAIEAIIKLLIYYLHERVWLVIPFGKMKHPVSALPVKKVLKAEDIDKIENKLTELGYIE